MREDEARAAHGRQVQLLRNGHEVVAVGAQAVQHDQAGARGVGGLQFDAFERHVGLSDK